MSIEALRSGRVKNVRQDSNREFISLLAYICVDGTTLLAGLIYKGISYDLQDTWLDDFDSEEEVAYFAASSNGWSCDSLGYQWLRDIFDRHTKEKARPRKRRILIVDGHSSHVNMKFLDLADKLRILIHILPPHSTHRLQPLDIGLFSPLSTAYSTELNKLIHESESLVSITKRMFYRIFKKAFKIAFTQENIEHAFAKPGIWPFNLENILSILRKPIAQSIEIDYNQLQTPKTTRAIRYVHNAYIANPVKSTLSLILKANIHLAAQQDINNHIIHGLRNTIQIEKSKRQRGKRLNLLGEEDNGPQFFSPARIQAAREFQAQKEAMEEENKARIASKKALALVAKEKAEATKKERALQRAISRENAAVEKARKIIERQAILEARKARTIADKASKLASKASKGSRKAILGKRKLVDSNIDLVDSPAQKRPLARSTSGRAIVTPARFN